MNTREILSKLTTEELAHLLLQPIKLTGDIMEQILEERTRTLTLHHIDEALRSDYTKQHINKNLYQLTEKIEQLQEEITELYNKIEKLENHHHNITYHPNTPHLTTITQEIQTTKPITP